MKKKVLSILKSKKAEANYISSAIYILIVVICIAFILNIFSIISAKQELDYMADQMTKQIQLAGGVNDATEDLFNSLKDDISGASNVTYSIDTNYVNPTPSNMIGAIQLSEPFYIIIIADTTLAGFGDFDLVNICIQAKGTGVSEIYWKWGEFVVKLKSVIKSKRGEVTYFTAFFIVAVNMLIIIFLTYFSVFINVSSIRSSTEMELNNLSARISDDTYSAKREGNLTAYLDKLNSSNAYQSELKNTFIEGLDTRLNLNNDMYSLENIELSFNQLDDSIEYVVTCDIYYYIDAFGSSRAILVENISLTGKNITKY